MTRNGGWDMPNRFKEYLTVILICMIAGLASVPVTPRSRNLGDQDTGVRVRSKAITRV